MIQHPNPDHICENPKCKRYFAGQSNQKYCNTQCKNSYHNAQNRNPNHPQVKAQKQLKANYKILIKVFAKYLTDPVPRSILEYEGFDFDCHTSKSLYKKTGKFIYFTFDLGIEALGRDTYRIHLKEEDLYA